MKKSEMYNLVVDKVCEICEVRRDTVINGRKMQAVVDARILIVQYLKRIGLSSDDIALLILRELAGDSFLCPPLSELKKKAKAVDKIFNFYSSRCLESYSFCLMSVDVKEWCRNRYKEYYIYGMKELPPKK